MLKSVYSPVLALLLMVLALGPAMAPEVLAAQPNIVLSQALYFSTPTGQTVSVKPGKYLVEQAGTTHMRLRAEDGTEVIDLQAQSLTHEQYELFSAMAMTRPGEEDLMYIELLLPGGVRLQSTGSISAGEVSTTAVVPSVEPSPVPSLPPAVEMVPEILQPPSIAEPSPVHSVLVYVPPSMPISGERLDGVQDNSNTELPDLFVLAPDHTGLTVYEQPTLYWVVTKYTDRPIDIRMSEEDNLRIVLDARVLPPIEAGMHELNLKDYDVRLLNNVSYQWTASISFPTASSTVVASGFVRRVILPPSLTTLSEVDLKSPGAPKLYAEAGLWYDAFGTLSELIRTQPQNGSLLQQRHTLLNQVGLEKVATALGER